MDDVPNDKQTKNEPPIPSASSQPTPPTQGPAGPSLQIPAIPGLQQLVQLVAAMQAVGRLPPAILPNQTVAHSLLDVMEDGREFESLLQHQYGPIDLRAEIRRSIAEIEECRGRPLLCYVSNVVKPQVKAPTFINPEDELPFNEMVSAIDPATKAIDILLVTPGGSAQQVDKFVSSLRPRFNEVAFILPNVAMSAGTIFIMSGDEIIMSARSAFGPIDPQVPNKDGVLVPAQTIRALIEDIQKRGEELIKKQQNPLWTDIQILRSIDPLALGNELTASKYSVDLVTRYLRDYKFKSWTRHSNGREVTDEERERVATDIAEKLCNHGLWKAHSHGIQRETARSVLGLKITDTESIDGLDRAVRRIWALLFWIFETTPIFKALVSDKYCIFKQELALGFNQGVRQ